MTYKAKPVSVQALQLKFEPIKFHQWLRKQPQWFVDKYHAGEIMITNHVRWGQYATILKQDGSIRANVSDWIVLGADGQLFILTDPSFQKLFRKKIFGIF